jgi:hypothetical protein
MSTGPPASSSELLTWEGWDSYDDVSFFVAGKGFAQPAGAPVAFGVAENKKIPSTSL